MHHRTRLIGALVSAAVATGGALAVAPSSEAASGAAAAKTAKAAKGVKGVKAPIDCPHAYPVGKVTKGLRGTGFTVESGTAPAPFSAKVLGRLTDGLAPGVDLIIAKVSSPAISRAHGIWAGISGSPVYTADGRLLGSVSYGLGTNSDIAGLTPASAVLSTFAGARAGAAAAPAKAPARVRLDAAQARDLAAAGAVPATQAAGGFSRVPTPVTVSGKPTKRVLDYLGKLPDVRLVTGGARTSGKAAAASAIHAGGNFVSAISYGDYTVAAVGTTTAVCRGRAVAFGHPFLDSGRTQLTAHSAVAVEVQPDSLLGAFKLANPGGVVGVVDNDLNYGIRATLGAKPSATTRVSTSITVGKHKAVKGSTTVLYAPAVANVAANHVYADLIAAIGYEGAGSAKATVVVKGVRGNGKAFTLTRRDVFSDPGSLPYAVADSVYGLTSPLVDQEFENLRITSIAVTAGVRSGVHRYSVSKVEAQEGGTYVRLGSAPVPVTPGTPLRLRVTLTPYKGIGAVKVVALTLPVPAGSAGGALGLEVQAGREDVDPSQAGSGNELLKLLAAAAPNDSVRARLVDVGSESGSVVSSVATRVGTAVAGYDAFYDVAGPSSPEKP